MEEGRPTDFDGAFLDLWLLGECDEVVTTPASSFGYMATARTGRTPVTVTKWGKCLRPLPDKWKGLTDPEARVRARYVDLAINPVARGLIRARSDILHSISQTLFDKGFLEVETPILQQIHGGANARPFQTHINAYDLDLYLRIAP